MSHVKKDRPGRQHVVPAAYIGLFAQADKRSRRLRERPVWVADRRAAEPFLSKPESRAWWPGLYDLPHAEHLGGHLDHWPYESSLPAAIRRLADENARLDALTWVSVLVPFVAGLWVRGPDRNDGVNNEGRVIELQEVLSPVMAAQWTVLHFPGDRPVVTSDRAFATMSVRRLPSVVLPLTSSAALVLSDHEHTRIRRDPDRVWLAPIEHDSHSKIDPGSINRAIAAAAIHDIYGPTRDSVQSSRSKRVVDPHSRGLAFLATDTDLRAHFYDWFRVLAALRAGPGYEQQAADRAQWDLLHLPGDTPIAVQCTHPERNPRRRVLDRWRISGLAELRQSTQTCPPPR